MAAARQRPQQRHSRIEATAGALASTTAARRHRPESQAGAVCSGEEAKMLTHSQPLRAVRSAGSASGTVTRPRHRACDRLAVLRRRCAGKPCREPQPWPVASTAAAHIAACFGGLIPSTPTSLPACTCTCRDRWRRGCSAGDERATVARSARNSCCHPLKQPGSSSGTCVDRRVFPRHAA